MVKIPSVKRVSEEGKSGVLVFLDCLLSFSPADAQILRYNRAILTFCRRYVTISCRFPLDTTFVRTVTFVCTTINILL